jgi:hypothetical protein
MKNLEITHLLALTGGIAMTLPRQNLEFAAASHPAFESPGPEPVQRTLTTGDRHRIEQAEAKRARKAKKKAA